MGLAWRPPPCGVDRAPRSLPTGDSGPRPRRDLVGSSSAGRIVADGLHSGRLVGVAADAVPLVTSPAVPSRATRSPAEPPQTPTCFGSMLYLLALARNQDRGGQSSIWAGNLATPLAGS